MTYVQIYEIEYFVYSIDIYIIYIIHVKLFFYNVSKTYDLIRFTIYNSKINLLIHDLNRDSINMLKIDKRTQCMQKRINECNLYSKQIYSDLYIHGLN